MTTLLAGRATNDPTNYFGFGFQCPAGVITKGVTATKLYFLRHEDGTGFDVQVDYAQEHIGGAGKEIGLTYRKKETSDGQAISYAFADAAGRLLYAALGHDAVATGASVPSGTAQPYVHSLTSQTTDLGTLTQPLQLPYLTMQQGWADVVESTQDNIISELKIDVEAQMPVKLTASFVCGGTYVQGAPLYIGATGTGVVREAGPPAMYPGASIYVQYAVGQWGATAASSVDITKCTLTIKNELDDAIQTSGLQRADVVWLNQTFDLEGTIRYVNSTIYQALVTQGSTLGIPTGVLTDGTFFLNAGVAPFVAGSTPVPAQSVQIVAPFIQFTGTKVNRLAGDGKTMYLDFTAACVGQLAPTPTTSIQATVTNVTALAYGASGS